MTCDVMYTFGAGQRISQVDVAVHGEPRRPLEGSGQHASSSHLGALDVAAESTSQPSRVAGVELARADLRRKVGDVVVVFEPPDLTALVASRVSQRNDPSTRI